MPSRRTGPGPLRDRVAQESRKIVRSEIPYEDALYEERLRKAEALLDTNFQSLVLNAKVIPRWTESGRAFWYRKETAEGPRHLFVDHDGTRREAFNRNLLLLAVNQAVGEDFGAEFNVVNLDFPRSVSISIKDRMFKIDLPHYLAKEIKSPIHETTRLMSPDGVWSAFTREFDLYLEEISTGREVRLTDDGEPYFEWGKPPDAAMLAVVRQRFGLALPPWGFTWSPDSRFLVGGRFDERHVEPYPIVAFAPQDGTFRPKVYYVRQALPGENPALFSLHCFDIGRGERVAVQTPPRNVGFDTVEPLAWSPDFRRFYLVQKSPEGEAWLDEVDALTGQVRRILTESITGYVNLNVQFYNTANVRLIDRGRSFIWFSERSGWGHLYRYDLESGVLLNVITSGHWLVRDILHVDELKQRIIFSGSGREPGDIYNRAIYRVGFDGSDLTLLTPERADHSVDGQPTPLAAKLLSRPLHSAISPDGALLVDTFSSVDQPPVTWLRSTDTGALLLELERADTTALDDLGLKPPQAFIAKAADGATDLYGVIYWPPNASIATTIPIIDAIYGGPQLTVAPHDFMSVRSAPGGRDRDHLATLGFAVVVIDARGTPLRSKEFQNAGFGRFADLALEDHVAVIRQLGDQFPSLDVSRVGVYGHSFGGYAAARALLKFPDFFKVGVASAGSHIFESLFDNMAIWIGPPDYGDGEARQPSPTSVPHNYRAMSNAALAANLRGKLLLAFAELDENAWPSATIQLIDALIRAGKSYDLLYMPNKTHDDLWTPYARRRLWGYFLEHLADSPVTSQRGVPLADHSIDLGLD